MQGQAGVGKSGSKNQNGRSTRPVWRCVIREVQGGEHAFAFEKFVERRPQAPNVGGRKHRRAEAEARV